ncbi:MAG: MotE family protein [Pseudomonadota bacterium]
MVFLPVLTSLIGTAVLALNLRYDIDYGHVVELIDSPSSTVGELNLATAQRVRKSTPIRPSNTAGLSTASNVSTTIIGAPAAGERVSRRNNRELVSPIDVMPDDIAALSTANLSMEPSAGPEETLTCHVFDAPLDQVARDLKAKKERLDERSREVDVQTEAMRIMRDQLAEDLGRLEALRAELQSLVEQVDQQEEERLKQLVKVYETMKAKRAADIFDRLDPQVILAVATRMREAKLADILAAMNPDKARMVTMQLAAQADVISQ